MELSRRESLGRIENCLQQIILNFLDFMEVAVRA